MRHLEYMKKKLKEVEEKSKEQKVKYLSGKKDLWRYRYKNGVEDLKKAEWYLTKLIEVVDVHKS